ncbi:MAG: hypothetical protein ACOH1H_00950 [Brevundimonas sp.]
MTDAPPPPEEWQQEQPWEDDSLALFEGQRDPLDAQIQEQDKRNRLRFKKATGRIIVWSVYGMWGLLAIGLLVWTWHFLTPCPFLEPHQIEKLQSVIFSGSLGAVISILARNYIRE